MKQSIYIQGNKTHTYKRLNSLIFKYINASKTVIMFSILIVAILSSCWDKDIQRDLIIKNNSSDSIYVIYTEIYPDTTLDCRLAAIGVGANQEYRFFLRNGWENELGRIGILQLFIIDKDIWNTEPCDTIKKSNKILKRYQLTLDDLRNLNWRITYP
jgi:hypothetical protein